MLSLHPVDLVIVALYLVAMIAAGFLLAGRVRVYRDFFLAGRSLTTPILICTLVSTYYGIDVTFGTSEVAYNEGIVAWFGYSRPTYLFFILAAFLLAKRLRNEEYRSLPDVLERFYGRGAGILGAIASFVYSLPSLGFFGLGTIYAEIFGGDARVGGLLFGLVALLYTMWGGLWAVAIIDTIQFVMLCASLAIAIPVVMGKVGGFGYIAEHLPSTYFDPMGGLPIWLVIVYAATGLTILVDPAFYQRIFAAKSFRHVRNALLLGILMWGSYDWCVTAGGMLAAAAVNAGMLPQDLHPNAALLRVVLLALPAGLTGLFLAGVLSAAMSTIDSYCLVAGGNVVYDIYRPVFNPGASDDRLVRLTKWGIGLAWVIGYAVAFYFERLMALWVFMSTILTSTVFVPIIAGLYYRGRKTQLAGLLGCAFGLASCVLYYLLVHMMGTHNEEYGTFIWTFELGGRSISLWQEYALLLGLPMSLAGFVIGNLAGRREGGTGPVRIGAPA